MSQFLQSFGLLIARLGTGGILLLHGITHWTGANQGVAVMRDREVIASPGPEFVFEANDVVVAVGTRQGLDGATAILAGDTEE